MSAASWVTKALKANRQVKPVRRKTALKSLYLFRFLRPPNLYARTLDGQLIRQDRQAQHIASKLGHHLWMMLTLMAFWLCLDVLFW